MKPMQDKDLLTTRWQRGNALLEAIDGLPMRDGIGDVRRSTRHGAGIGVPRLGMGLSCRLGTKPIDRAMRGDMPKKRKRLHDLACGRALEQLHADVLQHVAREMPISKTPPHVVDQLVVMTQ